MKIKPKAIATTFTLLCGMTPAAWGQAAIPAAGPAAAAPAAASPLSPPGSAAAAAAGQRNLWSFFCMTPEQKLACKEKICATTFGQFLNNSLKGPGAFTGGIIPECCPPVKSADLLKPSDTAEGAADKI